MPREWEYWAVFDGDLDRPVAFYNTKTRARWFIEDAALVMARVPYTVRRVRVVLDDEPGGEHAA